LIGSVVTTMNVVDVAIIVLIGLSIVHGARSGLVAQALSLAGVLGGLVLGAALAPHLSRSVTDPTMKAFVGLACVFGTAALLSTAGHVVGARMTSGVRATAWWSLDSGLGAVLAVAVTLATAWLVGNMVTNNPTPEVATAVQSSAILQFLDRHLPPAPPVIARIQGLLDTSGLPQVFSQLEPPPAARLPLPNSATLRPAIAHAAQSTMKIEGQACGQIQEGSGFVYATGDIITNAHVVAGVRQPFVVAPDGTTTRAATVFFDPNLDLAVLRDTSVHAPPLTLALTTARRGTSAVVLGYPGGGPFDAQAAVVLDQITADGRNIYGTSTTSRAVYELESNVRPGNSGGPLVASDGTVVGVAFARSVNYNDIGYALTSPDVRREAISAEARTAPTSTGACTTG
jgi:S1-C subfamily serine protease